MSYDMNNLRDVVDLIDKSNKHRTANESEKTRKLLEEQVRLQREANELEKKRQAQEHRIDQGQKQQPSLTTASPIYRDSWIPTKSKEQREEEHAAWLQEKERVFNALVQKIDELKTTGIYEETKCPHCPTWKDEWAHRVAEYGMFWGIISCIMHGCIPARCGVCAGSRRIYVTRSGYEIAVYEDTSSPSNNRVYARMGTQKQDRFEIVSKVAELPEFNRIYW